MLVVFPPIFAADTKIIYGYNFVAPLRLRMRNFQGIIFICTLTYREIFKSALVYL